MKPIDPLDPSCAVAVVGLGAIFPDARNVRELWSNLVGGRDSISDVPRTHWLAEDHFDPDPSAPDKTYCRRGGFLPKIAFDAVAFGVPPAIAPATDTAQLLALVAARDALEDAARGPLEGRDFERAAVVLGTTSAQELMLEMSARLQRPIWVQAMREGGLAEADVQRIADRIADRYVPWQENTFPGLLGNVIAGRIANRFDFGGTNCVTDAACASSLSAVAISIDELRSGRADLVLTGGVDTMNDVAMYVCFSKTPALSPTGDCRPFSEDADGTMLGEGLGMLVFKRLADAERDGDPIYAVIRGLGTSSDGRALSIYAPLPAGQARCLRRAYAAAGYEPSTVELVEAHGTGTKAGDAAELEALETVFGASRATSKPWCAIGSVKSQIGHTKSAAGAAGLLKAVLALHHRVLPPTIKVARPAARLAAEGGAFYANTEARPWIRDTAEHLRRASVSSFGFGGSNFHVTVEEYAGSKRPAKVRLVPSELVVLSADSPHDLAARVEALAGSLALDAPLEAIARETQVAFSSRNAARLAVIASDAGELRARLLRAADAVARDPEKAFTAPSVHYGFGPREGKTAWLFPGQGSQYVGMGAALAMTFDRAREAWDRAAALAFEPELRLHDIVFPRPAFDEAQRKAVASRLTATEWAQPALGAASAALASVLRAAGLAPDCVGGHSFGEVAALYAAGVLTEIDMLRVARRRGELMARAAEGRPGAMTAVAIDAAFARAKLDAWGLDLWIANDNGSHQVVISGTVEAIAEAERRFAEDGVTAQRLPVATAFHSPIVASAREPFDRYLAGVAFAPARVAVYSNADAAPYPTDVDGARALLVEQIARPVRFAEMIARMHADGARTFVEVGAGNVLSGLVERCLAGLPHAAIALDAKRQHGVTSLWNGLGRLAALGHEVDFAALWAEFGPMASPRPSPKFSLSIQGSNYGKLYPPPDGPSALLAPNAPKPPVASVAAPPPPALDPPRAAPPRAVDPPRAAPSSDAARYVIEAHAIHQKALTESHTAFLQTMEASFGRLVAALGGGAADVALPARAPEVRREPALRDVPIAPPAPIAPAAPRALVAPPPAPAIARTKIEPRPAAAPAAVDHAAVLLDVVAVQTGYPAEMLSLDMALEADLGIDSIKRVEILAELRKRIPDLPTVAAGDLASLRTIGSIAAFLRDRSRPSSRSESKAPPPAEPRPSATPTIEEEPPPLARAVVRAIDAAPRAGRALAPVEPVVVTRDGRGVAEALVAELGARGVRAVRADAVPGDVSSVVFLGGLRDVQDVSAAIAINREAFDVARAIAPRVGAAPGLFVTVQDTGGDFGLSGRAEVRAWLGLTGLVKTAALEWPSANVRAIDVARGDRSAEAIACIIADVLEEAGGEIEIGIDERGERRTLAAVPEALVDEVAGALPLEAGAVILASGGARGVTAACLLELARAARLRIAILGRTPLADEPVSCRGVNDEAALKRVLLGDATSAGVTLRPAELGARVRSILAAREVRANLDALRAAGAEVRYVAVDVCDVSAVRAALGDVRSAWGPVRGVIHGAGVLADKRIAEKSDADFARVFDTKVEGLRALLDATRDDPLGVIAVLSSVAARSGNEGQCDYAMANEAMNRVAAAEQLRRGGACVVRAIDWGPWDGGMVQASLAAHFASRGVELIPLAAGARAFVRELRRDVDAVEVVLGAALPQAALDRTKSFVQRVHVDAAAQPYLRSHSVRREPVLPMVLAIEWFARASEAARPDLAFVSCEDLRVLKGAVLSRFDDGGHAFEVRTSAVSEGEGSAVLAAELVGDGGQRHYVARVRMERGRARAVHAVDLPPRAVEDGAPQAIDRADEAYRTQLFHGSDFRVLQSIDVLGPDGARARVEGTRAMGWSGDGWVTDPAALDGGLQLAVVWGHPLLGAPSLPTAVAEVRLYRRGLVSGPIDCVLRAGAKSDLGTELDLTWLGPDAEPIAEFRGTRMHALFGLPAEVDT